MSFWVIVLPLPSVLQKCWDYRCVLSPLAFYVVLSIKFRFFPTKLSISLAPAGFLKIRLDGRKTTGVMCCLYPVSGMYTIHITYCIGSDWQVSILELCSP